MAESYKKHVAVEEELEYLERQYSEMKDYLDGIDPATLEDRIHWRQTKTGQMPMLVASIEQQVKSKYEILEKLSKLVDRIDEVRNKYMEKEFKARGNIKMKHTGLDFANKMRQEEQEG